MADVERVEQDRRLGEVGAMDREAFLARGVGDGDEAFAVVKPLGETVAGAGDWLPGRLRTGCLSPYCPPVLVGGNMGTGTFSRSGEGASPLVLVDGAFPEGHREELAARGDRG